MRDATALPAALSITPEYLRNTASESGAVVDYRDWQVSLGRRFRALKLWTVLHTHGLEGLRAHIRGHVALAAELAERVRPSPASPWPRRPRSRWCAYAATPATRRPTTAPPAHCSRP